MGTDNVVIDLSGFTVGLSDAELEKASQLSARLTHGSWYKFQVTAGAKVEINRKSGNMSLVLPVTPLDTDDQPRKPSMRYYITLPWSTPTEALEQAGLPGDLQSSGKGAPNTHFLVAIYLRAVYGVDQFPVQPRFDSELKGYTYGDDVLDREAAETISAELTASRDSVFSEMCADPKSFEGDIFFAQVGDREGSDFQEIVIDTKAGTLPANVIPDGSIVGTF